MSVLDRETEITENTQIAKNTENTARSPRSAEVAASSAVVARDPHVTLVEGSSFCVSDHAGTIEPGGVHGLFVRDTRVLSRWKLYVDGYPVEPLTVVSEEPFSCRFLGRCAPRPGLPDATLITEVRRYVGQGMREDITLHNHGAEAAGVEIHLEADADFADLFEVKDRRGGGRRVVGRRSILRQYRWRAATLRVGGRSSCGARRCIVEGRRAILVMALLRVKSWFKHATRDSSHCSLQP